MDRWQTLAAHKTCSVARVIPAKHFLLTQRAAAEGYPPVLHQARILQNLGDVSILDVATSGHSSSFLTSENVRRVRIKAGRRAEGDRNLAARIAGAMAYRRELRKELRDQVEVVVAFDPDAAALVLREVSAVRRPRIVVHFHEHLASEGYASSRISRWSLRTLRRRLPAADVVVVADKHRGDYLLSQGMVSEAPLVVMNCPPRLHDLPASRLLPTLGKAGIQGRPIVHYQGAIGRDHGLEVVLRSIPRWPKDAVFVAVGHGDQTYLESLRRLAADIGAGERFILLGRVPYDQVLSYAVGATVAVTLLDTRHDNWRLAAGASNKRFEYVAIGVPQVTNEGPGIQDLFEIPGVALAANPSDPDEVGNKIAVYLNSASIRQDASRRARELHLSRYNYEHQYQAVLERLGLAP